MVEAILVSAAISIIGILVQIGQVKKIAEKTAKEVTEQKIKNATQEIRSTGRGE